MAALATNGREPVPQRNRQQGSSAVEKRRSSAVGGCLTITAMRPSARWPASRLTRVTVAKVCIVGCGRPSSVNSNADLSVGGVAVDELCFFNRLDPILERHPQLARGQDASRSLRARATAARLADQAEAIDSPPSAGSARLRKPRRTRSTKCGRSGRRWLPSCDVRWPLPTMRPSAPHLRRVTARQKPEPASPDRAGAYRLTQPVLHGNFTPLLSAVTCFQKGLVLRCRSSAT